MTINENTGPKFEENQLHQPPAILTRRTPSQVSVSTPTSVLTPSNVHQRHDQQEETNSPSDSTLSSPNGGNAKTSPSDFSFSLSNRGNQILTN